MRRALLAVVASGTVAAILTGCSVGRALAPDSYTVKRGDTLVAIARHYDLNWHDLARWNHINPPYRLNVGQRLTLDPYPPINYANMSGGNRSAAAGRPAPRAPESNTAPNGQTQPLASPGAPTVTRESTPASPPPAQASNASSQPQNASGGSAPSGSAAQHKQPASDTNAEENSIDSASTSRATQQAAVKAGGPSADGWQWPASGSLLQAYDASARRRGIEIGGKIGAPIYAASSGTVVYNGTGLKGYGKLIIVKHNAHYLSAYGFNQKSLVKRGQTVAAGAHIADMGLGPGNKPMLLFEIRRDGDPIDPQKVLPSR